MESSSSSSTLRSTTTNTSTSELFICFSSRNSSMKTSKTSILSPGRARDPPSSLSTSLSRRLKSSGSIKNGQASPMFPTGNKKRGSGFDNPEPSSPKVTCIGQVRVKTKKQGKKMRNLSRRPSGEMSFRKVEHGQIQRQSSVNSIHHQQECSSHRNQRWVHLPLTICETLRGFGSEFSCLFPCKSSCFSGEKEERDGRESGGRTCVDVFAKWLVAVEDESRERGGERRDIELVVEEDEDDDDDDEDEGEGKVVKRRHVFDEIEIKDYDEERGRVSICIPPKNALLLMRCRSDPVKMEALASRFWESQLPAEDEEEDRVFSNGEEKAVVNLEKVEVEEVDMEVFEERRASISGNIFDKVEESKEVFEERRASVSGHILDKVEESKEEVEMELFEERRASVSGHIFDEVEESKVEQMEESEVEQEDIKLELEVEANEVLGEDSIVGEQVQDSEKEKILEDSLHACEELQYGEEEEAVVEESQSSVEALAGEEEKVLDLESDEQAQACEQEEIEDRKILVEDVEENESSFVTALEVFVNQERQQVVEGESRVSCCSLNDEAKLIRCILLDDKSDDEVNTPEQKDNSDEEVSKPEQEVQEQEPALASQANDSTDDAEAEKETQPEPQTQTLKAHLELEEQQEETIDTDYIQDDEVHSNAPLVLETERAVETKKEESEAQKLEKLPDCLLLMMCEPKLSMEVSKETWVCSTDFIRWRPQKKKAHAPPCQYKKSSPVNEEQVTEKRKSVDSKCDNPFAALPPPYPVAQNQPARASCCLPAAGGVSMATMIEQKLVDAVAYEPFVLTRCKSEPMRTASKLAQGACFWKNRAMEPHRRATYGAAGVGC
ncbi:hypothetical protein POM88_017463 [Heracleum sosnowskyi]|uniref:Uncharacterized protein n=1 Tax=Heracleum sosnowskyi TaxID=360622 RepID=A0AAD8IP99_9APIA|nr:hypothetical protein POM88_017463 [Heracleum sosnowskyi]